MAHREDDGDFPRCDACVKLWEKEARQTERARILKYMREEICLGKDAQDIANVIAEEIEHLNHYEKPGAARSMPPKHHDHDVSTLDGGGYCEDCHVELPKADIELIRASRNRWGLGPP